MEAKASSIKDPSYEGYGAEFLVLRFLKLGAWTLDLGPWIGDNVGITLSALDLIIEGGAGLRGLRLKGPVYFIDRPPVCFLTLVISVAKIIQTMLEVLQFVICNR